MQKNLLKSYLHMHLASVPLTGKQMVSAAHRIF